MSDWYQGYWTGAACMVVAWLMLQVVAADYRRRHGRS